MPSSSPARGVSPTGTATPAPTQAAPPSAEVADAVALGDARWEARTDPDNVREAIAHWEGAIAAEPSDAEVLVKLTHAYYFLADGYLRDDDDAYLEALDRGVRWGERAMLAASPEFAAAMADDAKYSEAIARVGPTGVPAMFWYATALGKWAKKQGIAVMLDARTTSRSRWSASWRSNPRFSAVRRTPTLASTTPSHPPSPGATSRRRGSTSRPPWPCPPTCSRRRSCGRPSSRSRSRTRPDLDPLLAEVLAADEAVIPRITAENRIEQGKARELLARRDELF